MGIDISFEKLKKILSSEIEIMLEDGTVEKGRAREMFLLYNRRTRKFTIMEISKVQKPNGGIIRHNIVAAYCEADADKGMPGSFVKIDD